LVSDILERAKTKTRETSSTSQRDIRLTYEDFDRFFSTLLRLAFRKLDKDRNGVIQGTEVSDLVKYVCPQKRKTGDEAAKKLMLEIDEDASGSIDQEEFSSYVLSLFLHEARIHFPEQVRNLMRFTMRDVEGWDKTAHDIDDEHAREATAVRDRRAHQRQFESGSAGGAGTDHHPRQGGQTWSGPRVRWGVDAEEEVAAARWRSHLGWGLGLVGMALVTIGSVTLARAARK